MNTIKQFILLFVLMLMLSGCGGAPSAIPATETAALDAVYTAVALTLSAQEAAASPTFIPKAVSTATPLASPTLSATSTQATPQNISAVVPVANTVTSCDNSVFLSDVTIPDGTIFVPGKSFTKTWSIQNSGTCAWSTSYNLVFVSGSALGGSTTALTAAVSSGGQTSVSVTMVAPSTLGTYTGYWKLQNAVGTSFGQPVYIQIVVSGSAATLTSTPTSTVSTSTTSTPTSISETATSTSVPTETAAPSSTPAPTSTPVPSETPVIIPSETPIT